MRKIRTAVVGCGAISDIFIENMINRFSVLDVVCCCSKNGESARAKAEKYGIRAVTLEDVLADESIELAVNLTPPTVHYELISRLLNAGKHVYTEKALAPTSKECRELCDIARRNGARLGVAPDTFLGAGLQTARAAVDSGVIGTVTSFHAGVNRDMDALYPLFRFTTEPGGGIGFDFGIYFLTAILSILGPAKRAAGMIRTIQPTRRFKDPASPSFGKEFSIQNENVMTASLELESGVLGTLHFNGVSIFPELPGFTIYGTEGMLNLPNANEFSGDVLLWKKGQDKPVTLPVTHGFAANSRGVGAAEMAWSIIAGREHRANAEMATHAVEVLEGITGSAQTGRYCELETRFALPAALPSGFADGYVMNNPESALV